MPKVQSIKTKDMARGNAYLIIAPADKSKKIPATLLARYGWTETTTDPNDPKKVIQTPKNPTWQELAERWQNRFGAIRSKVSGGVEYLVIELEFSFLKGDVAELLKLQKTGKKDFIILNNSEAQAWLAGDETIF